MKRGATRDDILRVTQDLIIRNGIRAVRVDEIAQTLGISKRTLYETFVDKTNLIHLCLKNMSCSQQQKISEYKKERLSNSLQQAFRIIHEFIGSLYNVDRRFLADIRDKVTYADHFHEDQCFWRTEVTTILERCKTDKYLLADGQTAIFVDRMLSSLFGLRLNSATQVELNSFFRTMLRGAATQQGIQWIDQNGPS